MPQQQGPLPTHLATFGISDSALSQQRHSGATNRLADYNSRVLAVKQQYLGGPATGASSQQSGQQGAAATRQAAPPPRYHVSRLSAKDIGRTPVTLAQLAGLEPGGGLNAGAGARSAGGAAAGQGPASSRQLMTSKLFLNDHSSTLVSVDFAAMADSSVGGTAGLPRPYGKFQAERAGVTDMYQRLPRGAAASWHERLYGAPLDRHLMSATAPPSAFSQQHQQEAEGLPAAAITGPEQGQPQEGEAEGGLGTASGPLHSTGALGQHSGHSRHTSPPVGPRSEAGRPYSTSYLYANKHMPGSTKSPSRGSQGSGLAHLDSIRFARPETGGSSNAGTGGSHALQLPAATFLTSMPRMPSNLRVDCGFSTAREFLTGSGHLSQGGGLGNTGTLSASRPGSNASATSPQGPQHQLAHTHGHAHAHGFNSQPPPALVASLSSTSIGSASMGRSSSPPGLKRLQPPPAALQVDAQTLGAEAGGGVGHGGGGSGPASPSGGGAALGPYGVPTSPTVLEAIYAANKPAPVHGSSFAFETDRRLGPARITTLPPELSLPRRNVPAVGR